ncbi:MAG: hypothetical protein KA236_07430 [Verrucomicrobia bacterium]|jgi:hypothetical protein|nr:hypothetical protein [Verrucomicrobiota bacterium]
MDTSPQAQRDQPFNWWRLGLLVFLSSVLVGGIFLWSSKPLEPQFQGKPLSSWLAKLDTGRFNVVDFDPVLDRDAAYAVQQIGASATPCLVARLKSALAAERTFFQLQDWPIKLPFKLMEAQLNQRMKRGREAQIAFAILGEVATNAIPELEAMIPGQEVQSESVLQALAAIGPASLGILSNAMQSSDYWLPQNAIIAAKKLGKDGAPLVPLLVAMLDDPKHSRNDGLIVRSLGKIGEPQEIVMPALHRSLLNTNDSVAGNAALGFMFMGGQGREAVPDIERRLITQEGKVNCFAVLSLVVLSTNDEQLLLAMEQAKSLRVPNELDEQIKPPHEVFAQIRSTWTNCNARERKALFAEIRGLISVTRTN